MASYKKGRGYSNPQTINPVAHHFNAPKPPAPARLGSPPPAHLRKPKPPRF